MRAAHSSISTVLPEWCLNWASRGLRPAQHPESKPPFPSPSRMITQTTNQMCATPVCTMSSGTQFTADSIGPHPRSNPARYDKGTILAVAISTTKLIGISFHQPLFATFGSKRMTRASAIKGSPSSVSGIPSCPNQSPALRVHRKH